MSKQFEPLNRDDVVSVDPNNFGNLDVSRTSRVVHLLEAIQEYVGFDADEANLFGKGMESEVLRLGSKGWQKGKIRINLEFCPDQHSESLSPLDDIRQNLKETQS